MKRLFTLSLIILCIPAMAQVDNLPQNASSRMMSDTESRLTIGGYAQIDYNQPVGRNQYNNGNLDVHRLVLLFGYKFSDRAQFVTELELEHVSEVFVEQAFFDYNILPWLSFRGGLMLVPMGITNEYHEPPTYNGVERPSLDNIIVPTTWREIGAGFTGVIASASIKYQLYVVNGFKSYDDGPVLRGSDGLRRGRQRGAESFSSSPNIAAKVDYFGVPGLKLGLSGYFGDSQSTLYDGLDKSDSEGVARADSSVVGVRMAGIDARYNIGGWEFRTQYNYAGISNTTEYNEFTGSDLGSAMMGYYIEAGYDVFHTVASLKSKLVPFVRYENYDTHRKTAGDLESNPEYDRKEIFAGIGWRITPGVVLKGDYQWFNTAAAGSETSGQYNLGIGIWF